MQLPDPVIVVPGITATYLRDDYPLPPDTIWSVMTKRFDRIRLHPDNLRFEVNQPARVLPGQVYEVAYESLIEELRHNLSPKEDLPVPVYAFGYDWRQPLEMAEHQLAEFVQEVIERTKLMRHYAEAGYAGNPKVNLIGHSMGGLIIAGYLASQRGAAPVSKVATLASPFRGSFEAVIKTVTGTAELGTSRAASREREAARVTPAMYHLMPSFEGALQFGDGLAQSSIFDPGIWQPSILASIQEYIRLHAVAPGNVDDQAGQARDLFGAMLHSAATYHEKLESIQLADLNMSENDWLAVAGVGSKTRVRLKVGLDDRGVPEFKLHSSDRDNRWTPRASANNSDQRVLTGDGTVPFEGAIPAFLRRENLVCITPDDFKYYEVGDRILTGLAGFHGILPNMNMLHRLLTRFFTNGPARHSNTWGWRAPGVARGDWAPPFEELRDNTKD